MNVEQEHLWGAAVATFGVGDILTTHYGLTLDGVNEDNPVAEAFLDAGGTEAMVTVKVVVFLAAFVAYHNVPEEYADGIPLGLALLGAWVVWHNTAIISEAKRRQVA